MYYVNSLPPLAPPKDASVLLGDARACLICRKKRVRPGRESLAYTRITVLGKARRSERDEVRRYGAKLGGLGLVGGWVVGGALPKPLG